MTENTAIITASTVVDAFTTAVDAQTTQRNIRKTADMKFIDVMNAYDALVSTTAAAVASGVKYPEIAAEAKSRGVKGLSQGNIGYIVVTSMVTEKPGTLRSNIIMAPVSANSATGKIPAFDGEGKPVMDDAGEQAEVSARSLYSTVKSAIRKVGKATVEAAIRNAADQQGAVEAIIALTEEPKADDKTRADYLKVVRGPLGKAAETSRDKGDDFDALVAEVEALVAKVKANA